MKLDYQKLILLINETVIALKQTGCNVSLAADLEKMKVGLAGELAKEKPSITDVIAERQRQIRKGSDSDHDDGYIDGVLALGGAAYAIAGAGMNGVGTYRQRAKNLWPFPLKTFNPADNTHRRENLIRGAAMIVAEIDKIDRATAKAEGDIKARGEIMKMTPQQQAQQCLNRNCLVLDTETTGLDGLAEIIEIAVIDAGGKVLLNTLVRPSKSIPADATAIHGITNEMVSDAPIWPEISAQVHALIAGKIIVIYNAEYDMRLLMQTDAIWGVQPEFSSDTDTIPRMVCAMQEYAEFYGQRNERGGYKWQKLTAAADQEGVTIEGTPHRALSDCLTTLGLIKAMAK